MIQNLRRCGLPFVIALLAIWSTVGCSSQASPTITSVGEKSQPTATVAARTPTEPSPSGAAVTATYTAESMPPAPTSTPANAPASTSTRTPGATSISTDTPTPTATRASAPAPAEAPLTTLLVPENASAGDPYMPEVGNRGYDVQRYSLSLQLDPRTTWIEGEAAIEAISTADQLRQVSLDLAGFEIRQVSVDGVEAGFFRQDEKLIINLPDAVSQGEALALSVSYAGAPIAEPSPYVPFVSHLGIHYQPESLFVVAEPDGARYWFPVNEHPRDKASYRFELTVPAGWVAVANGVLVETESAGPAVTYVWEHEGPMASAFATVVVGDLIPVESTSPAGVPLRHYVLPGQEATFAGMQPTLGEMIDWMGSLFGPYPFEAFGYVEITGMSASLETQTMVIVSEDGMQSESTLAHEMSHMWFGDWVSLDSWGDIWRSEGFATYIAQMWLMRDDPAGLDQTMTALTQQVKQSPSGYPLNDPPDGEMFGRDSYLKGAVVAHNLRKEMGDEAFFQGLRSYFELYGGGTASQADFQTVMEQAAGFSLESFFQEWLN